jgi:thiamine pyrophosphokinase
MMNNYLISETVIVADGSFPENEVPLHYIKNAARIVCCDGSAESLIRAGIKPDAIVGDMDSLNSEISEMFADRIFIDSDQETNDLTKAVRWCADNGYKEIVIVGATGKREDHTLGNISLLAEYIKYVNVIMVTDTGILIPFLKGSQISSFPGQQVSVFSIDPETEITFAGLKFPLNKSKLTNWWCATLNESLGDYFSLDFNTGRIIVYLKY